MDMAITNGIINHPRLVCKWPLQHAVILAGRIFRNVSFSRERSRIHTVRQCSDMTRVVAYFPIWHQIVMLLNYWNVHAVDRIQRRRSQIAHSLSQCCSLSLCLPLDKCFLKSTLTKRKNFRVKLIIIYYNKLDLCFEVTLYLSSITISHNNDKCNNHSLDHMK